MAGWVVDRQGSSVSLRGREWRGRLGLLCFGPTEGSVWERSRIGLPRKEKSKGLVDGPFSLDKLVGWIFILKF